ncbi:MAG: alpha-glucan family phosphorylase [Candidatus Methylarchaceae archaeon HK01B]|nr:alpha-glucan family phosphorylase [Candidatus Methylarchaceae archaeon HK01B]
MEKGSDKKLVEHLQEVIYKKLFLKEKIAYFSMEIGLKDGIPTYSGGLGILAGDTVRSSADLRLPLVAVTLMSKKGYFKQEITKSGIQFEHPEEWHPSEFMTLLPVDVTVKIQDRDVKIKAWLYEVKGLTGGAIPVLFLDTDVEGNTLEDREITFFLYGRDERYRLKQEIVLGIGGVKMLDTLGFKIRKYHMNEGHSSLLALELLRRYEMDIDIVRSLCIFTTHTPIEVAHDKFPYEIVKEIMGEFIPLETLKKLGGQERLNMIRLALNLSKYINGVAKRHEYTSKRMFPGYEIHTITNGIHSYTWTCESFRKIYDKYLPRWINEPELLVRVDVIPDEEIWQAHREAKGALIDYINKTTDIGMDYDTLTIGFARRATEYKRADLIFSDTEKLKKVDRKGKMQMVFAGKAHPNDESGKRIIREVFGDIEKLKAEIKIVYLEDYRIGLAAKLIPGVDLWLNTPLPPQEASGTSGMKAAHNGVINFSVLDGWWVEGWIEGVTGWAIGPNPDEELSDEERKIRELDDLFNKLEYVILPMFYQRRDAWITMMKNSIGKIAYYFNSHRMMRRYVTEAYF